MCIGDTSRPVGEQVKEHLVVKRLTRLGKHKVIFHNETTFPWRAKHRHSMSRFFLRNSLNVLWISVRTLQA